MIHPFPALAVVAAISLTFANPTYAQTSVSFQPSFNDGADGPTHNSTLPPAVNNEKPIRSNVSLNEINIHAYRHFAKNYGDVADEFWNKTSWGYVVSFMKNKERTEIYYQLNGNFQYSARYFQGQDINKDLKVLLAHRYPGYLLDVAVEISDGENIFYQINIHNSEKASIVRYCDGKLELIQEMTYGGL